MLLMDRLFDGRARRVEDVKLAFEKEKISGWSEYLADYGIHITKEEISGHIWAYKNDKQKKRVQYDQDASELVAKVLEEYGYSWDHIPMSALLSNILLKTRIGDYLKYAGVYICGDEEEWDSNRYRKTSDRGLLVPGFSELRLEDRNWLLGEYGEIKWMADEDPMLPGDIDGELLWQRHSYLMKDRVRKNEFMRCCELVNMYGSYDPKVIFIAGS